MNDSVTLLSGKKNKPSLVVAQKLVGGYVQLIELAPVDGDKTQMLIDEEGLLKGLPGNPEASFIAGQPIVGPAVVLVGDACWD